MKCSGTGVGLKGNQSMIDTHVIMERVLDLISEDLKSSPYLTLNGHMILCYLTSLSLSFLACKMRIIIVLPHRVVGRTK